MIRLGADRRLAKRIVLYRVERKVNARVQVSHTHHLNTLIFVKSSNQSIIGAMDTIMWLIWLHSSTILEHVGTCSNSPFARFISIRQPSSGHRRVLIRAKGPRVSGSFIRREDALKRSAAWTGTLAELEGRHRHRQPDQIQLAR